MGKRDLTLERQWRRRSRKYEQSGLTMRQFCEEEDLVEHQLAWWRRELKRRDGGRPRRRKTKKATQARRSETADFIPVQVAPSRPSSPIEIVFDDPLRIAVARGFDAQMLADVLQILEQRRC